MAEKVKIWFDREGDYLEVHFKEAPGYMKETAHDAVMEPASRGFSFVNRLTPRMLKPRIMKLTIE